MSSTSTSSILNHLFYSKRYILPAKRAVKLSLFLAILLFFIQIGTGLVTKSLLLFATGLIQLIPIVFLCIFSLKSNKIPKTDNKKFQLLANFLTSSILLLFSGHIFYELYCRLFESFFIFSIPAAGLSFIGALGNLFILKILSDSDVLYIRLKPFKISLKVLIGLQLFVALTNVIIHYSKLLIIDSIISLIISGSIFIFASFILIDAYFRIEENNHKNLIYSNLI